jgi:hypothetical protein
MTEEKLIEKYNLVRTADGFIQHIAQKLTSLQIVGYLYNRIVANMWMPTIAEILSSPTPGPYGVIVKHSRGEYVSLPAEVHPELLAAVQKINLEVAFSLTNERTDVIFNSLDPAQAEIVLQDGAQVQVVDSLAEICRGATSKVRKFQYACLVRRERIVLIWHNDHKTILAHAQEFERKLLALVCISESKRG